MWISEAGASSRAACEADGLSDAAVPIRMTGENEKLNPFRERPEDIQNAFLPDGIGVDQDIVEDENLPLVAGEFLGDGNAQAKQELLAGTLGKAVKAVHRVS